MSQVQGPCWVRFADGHVQWLPNGWKALSPKAQKLPCFDLEQLFRAPQPLPETPWQPQTRDEYEQAVWDAYRTSDLYGPFLRQCGLSGPDDFEQALESKVILNADDPEDIEINGPLYLGDHVLHTVTAFSSGLPFQPPKD